MTTPEILWMVHTERIDYLKEHEPRKMRKYLMEMGDEDMLRAWDLEQMEKGKKAKSR